MNIDLLDWSGKKHSVEIPDDTEEVTIKLVSGDMILLKPVYFDTGLGTKDTHFYGGEYTITRDKFKALSSLKGSYDLFSLAGH